MQAVAVDSSQFAMTRWCVTKPQ